MRKKYAIMLIVYIAMSIELVTAQSKVGDTTFNKELNKLEFTYSTGLKHISIQYRYFELDSIGEHRDSLFLDCLMVSDSMYVTDGQNIEMQNGDLRLLINTEDSTLIIDKPRSLLPSLFKLDIDNNEFLSAYASGYSISDSSGIRTMTIMFSDKSPIYYYRLKYYTSTYKVMSLEYVTKKCSCPNPANESEVNLLPNGYIKINVAFVYDVDPGDSPPTLSLFDPKTYFISRLGKLESVAPFANFEVINLVTEQ